MYPFARIFTAALGALCVLPTAWTQYVVPDVNADDISQQWTIGDTLPIQWKGWQASGARPDGCDLWITSFPNGAIEQRIAANLDLTKPGSFDWKVDLTDAQVPMDSQFFLRIVEHVDADSPKFPDNSPSMASRVFYLNPGASSSSFTSNPTRIIRRSSESSSGSSSLTNSIKKSNAGPIAGGVIGGLVGIALILGLILFFLKRVKNKRKATDAHGGDQVEKGEQAGYAYEMSTPPVQLPDGQQATELQSPTSKLREQ